MSNDDRAWVAKDIKDDTRPARGMWCPGNYFCRCYKCGCNFTGDKRSNMCADCAYTHRKTKDGTMHYWMSPGRTACNKDSAGRNITEVWAETTCRLCLAHPPGRPQTGGGES